MPNLSPRSMKTAKQIRGKLNASSRGTRRFWATVTAISAGPPKTVTLQQGTLSPVSGIRYDAGYTPTVGDTVYGDTDGNDYLVLGKRA